MQLPSSPIPTKVETFSSFTTKPEFTKFLTFITESLNSCVDESNKAYFSFLTSVTKAKSKCEFQMIISVHDVDYDELAQPYIDCFADLTGYTTFFFVQTCNGIYEITGPYNVGQENNSLYSLQMRTQELLSRPMKTIPTMRMPIKILPPSGRVLYRDHPIPYPSQTWDS